MSATDEYRIQAETLQVDVLKLQLRVAELEAELVNLKVAKGDIDLSRVPSSRKLLNARVNELSQRLTDEEVGDVVFLFMGKIVEVGETIRAVRERRVRR